MSVRTDPRPIRLPLPGGRAGATVKLHPLLTGEVGGPDGMFHRPRGPQALALARTFLTPPGRYVWVPAPAFLIEHPGAGAVLVDTGLHPSVSIDGSKNFGPVGRLAMRTRMTADQAASARLRTLGIDAARVKVVVMTHLHFDHASAVAEFPKATFVVDRVEWQHAIEPRGGPRGYHARLFDFPFDWRTVDYEDPAVDSFASFGRSVDLFGDGSVRLVSTPGHTHGHQSVVVRLRGREALICADAVYSMKTLDEGAEPLMPHDRHKFNRSLREIERFIEQSPGLLVFPGHDPEHWKTLEAVYE
jgi:glyoxylase-like metal-dependent hydrolase (beta-lactamase superfamily II)